MGKSTHQYTYEEILRMYHTHMDNYNNIIVELDRIKKSTYIKEKNVDKFLESHLRFCMEAVNVLNDAIVAIQNKAVDNSICLRLKGLFNSCTEEYINLQNTYSKLGEKIFEKFYTLKSIHIRLQKECDAMKFCDSTLIFVEAMVEKNSNNVIIIGNGNNAQIQQDVRYSEKTIIKEKNAIKTTVVEREKTSIVKIFKKKGYEAIFGGIFVLIAIIIYNINYKSSVNVMSNNAKIYLIAVMGILFICGVCLLLICLYDAFDILRLLRKGSFVELQSKVEWLYKFLEAIRNSESSDPKDIRGTGKCYMNIEGEIYQIKGKKCPYCEMKPIGNMYMLYSNFRKVYFWECSQNQSHRVEFDYKKNHWN